MNLVWLILIMQRGHVMLSPHFFILFLFIYLGTHRKKSDGGIGIFSLQNFFFWSIACTRIFIFFFSVNCNPLWEVYLEKICSMYITCTFIVS